MTAPSTGIRTRTYDFPPSGETCSQITSHGGDDRFWKCRVQGMQRTVSQENLFTIRNQLMADSNTDPKLKELMRRQDYGGNFESIRQEYWGSHPRIALQTNWIGGTYRYNGPVGAVPLDNVGTNSVYWPLVPSGLYFDMIQKGTTAIARTIPTNPAVGVGQFLGELREGLPSVPGKDLYRALSDLPKGVSMSELAKRAARGTSEEYLNYEFGIRPIISDTEKFVKAARDSDKIVKQLARDSGRLIRRRYSFPEEKTIQTITSRTGAYPWPPYAIFLNGTSGTYTHTREITTRMWFSGAYTYYYDQGQTLTDRMHRFEQEYNRLYGLRLSPALAWELAPWSWLVDWKSNVGDVITNISAFSRDGLVMPWAYMMCEMRIVDTHTVAGGTFYRNVDGATPAIGAITSRFTTTVKKRVRATPYGFGLDPDWRDFSVRQLAILSALGITRASR